MFFQTNKDGVISKAALQQIVSDQFADHNIGGIGVFITKESGTLVLKVLVGVKKYTCDPTSPSSKLFGHHYAYVGDIDKGNGEITKVDWDILEMISKVNMFKEKHHKTKLKDNPDSIILGPVKEDDAQTETISVRHAVYIPYCLMPLVLDKDLNPRQAFLLLYDTINANDLGCCQGLLDFCWVAGTLAKAGDTLPPVARDTARNVTAASIGRPLIRFMKNFVVYHDLKGLRLDTTKTSPVALQLAAAVTALTDVTIKADQRNEARREGKRRTRKLNPSSLDSNLSHLDGSVRYHLPKARKMHCRYYGPI